MIQCHRANHIRATRECDDADAVVWSAFDEFTCDFADRIDTRRLLSADCKILGQHRSGDIQRQDNIDPTGFDLSKTFAELRTREGNHEDRNRSQHQ